MIEEFLDAVHGAAADQGQHFLIWTRSDKASRFFSSPQKAAAYCAARAKAGEDVYTGVGELGRPPDQGRGKLEHITALTGMWADIDLAAGHAGSAKPLPPTEREARRIVEAMGPAPTLLVRSGGGLHAWWLFNELWVFADEEDKRRAVRLAARWNDTLRSVAQSMGYDADPVKDLTRVLRVAGTVHTGSGAMVTLADRDGPRYEPGDFEPFLMDDRYVGEKPRGLVSVTGLVVRPDAGLPAVVAELIASDSKFKRTWSRERTDMPDQSPSSYDFALVNEGVYRGWPDQVIADAIVAWRTKHNEHPEKAMRRDYLSRTIGKVRADQQAEKALESIEESLPPADGGPLSDGDRAKCLDLLSQRFGRRVLRFIKYTGEEPLYAIEFDGPKTLIDLGTVTNITKAGNFKNALIAGGNMVLDEKAVKKWTRVLELLMRVQEEEAEMEDEKRGKIEGWIAAYLKENPVSSGEKWFEGIHTDSPLVHAGYFWLRPSHLHEHMTFRRVRREPNELHRDLKQYGFRSAVAQKDARGERVQARYWRIPLDDVARVLQTHELERA